MDWTDFASPSGGFTRTDPALTTTLTFSAPLKTSIEQWPKERSDLHRRLHKSHKDSVPFNHDTSPRFGDKSGWDGEGEVRDSKGRVYIEEAFVDFWADIALGGGWVHRSELTFRESSWIIVSSLPASYADVDHIFDSAHTPGRIQSPTKCSGRDPSQKRPKNELALFSLRRESALCKL